MTYLAAISFKEFRLEGAQKRIACVWPDKITFGVTQKLL